MTQPSISPTPEQIAAFRLRSHHLLQRADHTQPVAVARDTGGLQAQVLAAARLALSARVNRLVSADVDRALWDERTLVKTWCMRRTLHLIPAADLLLYAGGVGRGLLPLEERWLAQRGIDAPALARLNDALLEALADGPLTREQLAQRAVELLGAEAREMIEHSWGGAVTQACLRGLICFGPDSGRNVTFARVDRWLPRLAPLPVDQSEETLLRRYLHAFGPATPQDYAAWSGLRVVDVNPIWRRIESDLVVVNGATWALRDDVPALLAEPEPRPCVCLLPTFDSFLLGHKDKLHLVDSAHYKRVYRKAGWISATVLVDGRVAGVWSQQRRGGQLAVMVEPFEPLSPAVRERIATEVERLGQFLGAEPEVIYGN